MKNKKGFTLVELLVVVVIMTGILVIALVSVNDISAKEKLKAKKRVEEEIVTAAKAYFKDNEYFLKNLFLTEEEVGYISLGTLVKLDYINAVTDPTTNQKYDMCSYVKVTSDGYEFMGKQEDVQGLRNKIEEEGGTGCDMEEPKLGIVPKRTPTSSTSIPASTEPPTINFNVELYAKEKSSCGKSGDKKDTIEFNDKNLTKSTKKEWYNMFDGVDNGIYLKIDDTDFVFEDTGTQELCITEDGEYSIKIKKSVDELSRYTLNIKLDRKAPTFDITANEKSKENWEENEWFNKAWFDDNKVDEVILKINVKDNLSGVKSRKRYWNKSGLTEAEANSSSYKLNEKKEYPKGSSTTENKNEIEANYSAQGYRKGIVKACDVAGNCDLSKEFTIKIDKKPPTISTFTVVSRATNFKSRTAKVSWNISDGISLIGKVSANITNKNKNNSWDRTSKKQETWNHTSDDTNYFIISDSYDGTSITPKLTACDVAGNCDSEKASKYTVYKELKCKLVKSTVPCESSANNLISGQVQVICNKKIKSINVTYTYDTNSSSCKANSTNGWTSNKKHNAAVFNFRGCGGSYVLKKAEFKIDDGVNTITKKADGFDLESETSAAPSCNPDSGLKNLTY